MRRIEDMEQMIIRNRQWSSLHFITHGEQIEHILVGAQMALEGGCRWIQLRMKDAPVRTLEAAIMVLKPFCRNYGAVLLIDDHVELAKEYGLDGVHLGLKDMPIDEARKILGEDFIIGGTANTLEQAKHQISLGADYLGIGPYRYTTTKQKLSPILGLEGYRSVMGGLEHFPVVAIGGIEEADIPGIMTTGVSGVAISGTILRSKNPVQTTNNIMEILKNI